MVTSTGLRIVFFGTPDFAVPTLDALLASRHQVIGVVTRADRPRGRGQQTSDTPVKARAVAKGIPLFQPERMGDPLFLEWFEGLHADLAVVVAYGKILTERVLASPRLGVLNVHASLLPKYRGAAPVHRAVINGDGETGITIMRMVKALDAGPMLATATRPIDPDETSDEVERDLARLGAPLLVSIVDALTNRPAPEMPQDDRAATYAPRITRDDGVVEWIGSADTVHNLIRGLHPWPHAFTYHQGRRLILLRSKKKATAASAAPGTIVRASVDGLEVATGSGIIAITELQAEGRRAMSARDFLAGYKVTPGDVLTKSP